MPPLPRGIRWILDLLVPLLVGLLCLWAALRWHLSACRGWPVGDPANHLFSSFELQRLPELSVALLQTYPPLVYLWSGLLYQLAEPSRALGELSVALFFLPLAWAVYQLGLRWGGRTAALLSVLFCCLNREVFRLGTTYLLDLPMTAFLALGLLFFLRSDQLRCRRWSLLMGVAMGAGLLSRYTFIFFVGPLLLLSGAVLLARATRRWWPPGLLLLLLSGILAGLYRVSHGTGDLLRHRPLLALWAVPALLGLAGITWLLVRRRLRSLVDPEDTASLMGFKNLCLAGLPMVLALPWYLVNLPRLLEYRQHMQERAHAGDPTAAALGLLGQLGDLWLGFPMMLAVGVAALAVSKKNTIKLNSYALIVISGAVSLVLTLLLVDAQPRFLVPLLPLLIPLACGWVGRMGPVRWILAGGILSLQSLLLLPALGNGAPLGLLVGPEMMRQQDPYFEQIHRQSCGVSRRLEPLIQQLQEREAGRLALVFDDQRRALDFWRQATFTGFDLRVLRHLLAGSADQVVLLHPGQGGLESWERETSLDLDLRPGDHLLLLARRGTPADRAVAELGSPPLPPAGALRPLGYHEIQRGLGFWLMVWDL